MRVIDVRKGPMASHTPAAMATTAPAAARRRSAGSSFTSATPIRIENQRPVVTWVSAAAATSRMLSQVRRRSTHATARSPNPSANMRG
jgi:hypothetical protein